MGRVNLTDTDLTEANILMAGLKDARVEGAQFPAGFGTEEERDAMARRQVSSLQNVIRLD
jgi:hypothetical protein